jgi:hypothetical protein
MFRRKLGFLFFKKAQGGMHDFLCRIVAALRDLRFDKSNEVLPDIETGFLIILHSPPATIAVFDPALKWRLALSHAYCAMPFPNDQFSFGTSKRFTKCSPA